MQQPGPYNYPSAPPVNIPPQMYPQSAYPSPQPPYPPQPYPQRPYNAMPQPVPGPYGSSQQAPAKPTGRIAFTRGLVFGLILVLLVTAWVIFVSLPGTFLDAINNAPDPFGVVNLFVNLMISLVQGVIAWIVYYFAGRVGARAGGKVSTGMLTCLWASLWYLLADFIGFFVLAALVAARLHDTTYVTDSIPGILQFFTIDAVLALLGLGIGAAGANKGAPRLPR